MGLRARPVLVENVVYLVRAGCITSRYPPDYFVKEVGHG